MDNTRDQKIATMETDNMSDAEQSIPSRGSHGSPFVWAITANGRFVEAHGTRDRAMVAVTVRESQMALIEGVPCDAGGTPVEHEVVPLYRQPQPTLTDADRESLRFCIRGALPETEKLGGVAGELCRMHRDRLRGLLERLGLEHAG